jgi:ABC-type oligopeptide transport system ATPase subunit
MDRSASHRLEERLSKREPHRQRNQVAFDERHSSTESSNHEHDRENEIQQERPIRPITKAKRKHKDKIHDELSDEEPRSKMLSSRTSYCLYA